MNLDQLEAEANQRIGYYINRSSGQHVRAMRSSRPKPETEVHPQNVSQAREYPWGSVDFLDDEPDEPSPHIKALKLLAWAVAGTIVVSMAAGWAYQTFFS